MEPQDIDDVVALLKQGRHPRYIEFLCALCEVHGRSYVPNQRLIVAQLVQAHPELLHLAHVAPRLDTCTTDVLLSHSKCYFEVELDTAASVWVGCCTPEFLESTEWKTPTGSIAGHQHAAALATNIQLLTL